MKPFIFNEQEYTDLNTLGLAFVEQYDLALQCVQGKEWLKFFKHFKGVKKKIRSIFYQSRYLQSALSMMIYWMTEEHVLYIGHKRYNDIASCLKDIRKNPAFFYFVEDHGFSNTILETIEDEKLKTDLQALESDYTDELSFEYLECFYEKDSLEQLHQRLGTLASARDPFLAAYQTFSDKEVQLSLAQKYSLKEVLELRKQKCPLFYGLSLTQDHLDPLAILDSAFYHFLYENYKRFKYKGKEAKRFKKEIKLLKKKTKKTHKLSLKAKIDLQEKLYLLYLNWIDLYYLNKIWIKEEASKPTIPYCHTFVPSCLQEEKHYEAEIRTEEFQPTPKVNYDLNQFYFSLKTHRNFAIWSIVLSILSFGFYFIFVFMDSLRIKIFELFAQMFQSELPVPEGFAIHANVFYFIGIGIVLCLSIFILILRATEKKKYKSLCKLAYYRKHESKLKEKEILEYQAIQEKESKYAKQIDHYYRFYGGVTMAGLSLCVGLSFLGIIYGVAPFFANDFAMKIETLFQTKIYFIAVAPAVCMLLSFLRHKKTAWTVIFTWFLSLIAAVGILFLV